MNKNNIEGLGIDRLKQFSICVQLKMVRNFLGYRKSIMTNIFKINNSLINDTENRHRDTQYRIIEKYANSLNMDIYLMDGDKLISKNRLIFNKIRRIRRYRKIRCKEICENSKLSKWSLNRIEFYTERRGKLGFYITDLEKLLNELNLKLVLVSKDSKA